MSELNQIMLAIQQPTHEEVFVGTGAETTVTVPLHGSIVATTFPTPATLFRKWYSSLGKPPDPMTPDASDTALAKTDQASVKLTVGSHIITYTVKDKNEDGVPEDDLEELFKSIEHIGTAGGPPEPPPAIGPPCVIHVLIANILTPANLTNLSKANAILEAEAPLQWGKYVEGAASYPERDPAYHAVNKVRYRWLFRRVAPPGPEIELDVLGGNAMTLIPPSDTVNPPPRLRYAGPLPGALVVGQQYTLTLRVEHADTPAQGHSVSRTVMIVA